MKGVRTAMSSKIFIRHALFAVAIYIPISGYNALLPIFIVQKGDGSDATLAAMMSSFGIGAALSAFLVQRVRHIFDRRIIIAIALFVLGIFYMLVALGVFNIFTYILCAIGGTAWASIISTMNSHTQRMFSTELRSRVIGIYMMVFYASLTLGSIIWSSVAKKFGIENTLHAQGIILIFIALSSTLSRHCSFLR